MIENSIQFNWSSSYFIRIQFLHRAKHTSSWNSHIQLVFMNFVASSELGYSFNLIFFWLSISTLYSFIHVLWFDFLSTDIKFYNYAKVLLQRQPIIISNDTKKKKKKVTYLVLSYTSTFMLQLICMYNRTDLCNAYTKRIIYP